MNSLAQTIAAAANSVLAGSGTYLRETPTFVGIDTSQGLLPPFIICADFTTTSVITPVGKEFDSTTATVFFADARPGVGDDEQAHAQTALRMESLQSLFFAELLRQDYQTPNRSRTELRDVYAAMLDGVGAKFTISIPARSLEPTCNPPILRNVSFTAVPTFDNATFVAA